MSILERNIAQKLKFSGIFIFQGFNSVFAPILKKTHIDAMQSEAKRARMNWYKRKMVREMRQQ